MLNVPYGAYHLLADDVRRHRDMANSDITPHAGKWKTMMHNKHSSFLVKLTIHDITNVPLVSGSFSVRWKFRGSKGDINLEPAGQSEPSSATRAQRSSSSLHRTFTAALTERAPTASPGSSTYPSPSSTGTSTPALVPGPFSSHQKTQSQSSADTTMTTGSNLSSSHPHAHAHLGLPSRGSVRSFLDKEITSTLLPLPSNVMPRASGSSTQHQHRHPGLHRHGHHRDGQERIDEDGQEDGLGSGHEDQGEGEHEHDLDPTLAGPSSRSPARLHVPHILLHRSENNSHTSLSSAFSGLGRKKRGAAVAGGGSDSGSTYQGAPAGNQGGGRQRVSSLASSIDSVPDSLRSQSSGSRFSLEPHSHAQSSRNNISNSSSSKGVVKLDVNVPIGTVTTPKGRTPIQELEDHGASWEYHVAQIVRIKLRPMDDEAWAAYAKRVGKDVKTGGTVGPSGNKGSHGRARQVGSSLLMTKDDLNASSEPAGWLGGGAKSDSGLKLVVYQHLAGMGLETIRSVSTRSEEHDDDDMDDGDDGAQAGNGSSLRGTISNVLANGDEQEDHTGSIASRTSTAKPSRRGQKQQQQQQHHPHRSHGHHEHDHPGIYFGELNLDLAEYASEEGRMGRGGVTRRYLLKGGKTNAMIKLTIEMSHHEGESNFITPPLQRGHNVAGITGAMENDIQLEHHLANLKAPHNSASSSSVSLAQSQSSMVSRNRDQLLRTVSSATIPLTEQTRGRPKKPPESHFIAPEHQHRFNQLYRRGYRNHGHRAVHDALKMGHREHRHRHRSSGAYSGEWSAEQVIDLIFNPLPVNRIDKVTPFTYFAEDAPDDAESVTRAELDDGAEARGETASLADSTGTTHEKRSRKFLQVLGGHGLRSHSTLTTPRDEASEKEKGLGAMNGGGQARARPRWSRNRTKMNES